MNKNIGDEYQSLLGKDLRNYWFKFFDPQTGTLTIKDIDDLPDENNPKELLKNYSNMFEYYDSGNSYLPELKNTKFFLYGQSIFDGFCKAIGRELACLYCEKVKVLKINIPVYFGCSDLFAMFPNLERLEFNYDYSGKQPSNKNFSLVTQFVLSNKNYGNVTQMPQVLCIPKPIHTESKKHLKYVSLPSTISQVSLQCVRLGLEIKINNPEAKILKLPSLDEMRKRSQATEKMRILLHKDSSTKVELTASLDNMSDEYKKAFYKCCSVVDIEYLEELDEINNCFKEREYDSIEILNHLKYNTTNLAQCFQSTNNQGSVCDSVVASLKIWFYMLFRHPLILLFDKNYSFRFHRDFNMYCNQLQQKTSIKCLDFNNNDNGKKSISEFVKELKKPIKI